VGLVFGVGVGVAFGVVADGPLSLWTVLGSGEGLGAFLVESVVLGFLDSVVGFWLQDWRRMANTKMPAYLSSMPFDLNLA
jgi:hypothetical protein